MTRRCDVLVIGAGPAGISAACCAAENRRKVIVMDDNPSPGGQIWRCALSKKARGWLDRLECSGAARIHGARVIAVGERRTALVDAAEPLRVEYGKLILATGARELLLPFPGWTLPGVTGAGGLQALVKGGLPIAGKRVAVAGSGPLLLAVADYLGESGASIEVIAEQTPAAQLIRFTGGLLGTPSKLIEGGRLKWRLRRAPYRTGVWPVEALAEDQALRVRFSDHRELECDYLACGFGLVPNLELPQLLGCEIQNGFVVVNEQQETSVSGIYCAGEPSGIGGLDASLVEGQIAGWAAAGDQAKATALLPSRTKTRRFTASLARAFALRDEVKRIAKPETIICRCEDITTGQLRAAASFREAKLHTRCGMGACQGRVCGAAAGFLYGWRNESVRPPVYPTAMDRLLDEM